MKTETIESIGTAGSKTIVTGAGLTGFGWLTSNEFLGLFGAAIAVAGLLITWYYKREANRRHALEHELRVASLRRGLEPGADWGTIGADDD